MSPTPALRPAPRNLYLGLLRVAGGEGNLCHAGAVQGNLEAIVPGTGEGNVKHQHRTGLHIHDAGRRLAELHRSLAPEQDGVFIIEKTNLERMDSDLGAPTADPEHQVRTWVHGGKLLGPDVLEHAQHAELSMLVDQRIVGDDGEINLQRAPP